MKVLKDIMSNATKNTSDITNATQAEEEVIEVTPSDEVTVQTLPIKFTLLGVPDVTDDNANKFKDAMLLTFKSLLSLLSSKLSGSVKFTNVSARYNSRRILQQEETMKNFQFYYDIDVASSDANANSPGEVLIESVKTHHWELLQSIQEYKKDNYYYVQDFEMCTPSNSEGGSSAVTVDGSEFDLCSYEHQIVPIQLGAVGLPNDLNVDKFNEELIGVYKDILVDVNGLTLAGIYPNDLKENGDTFDFHYNVDVLQLENRNMKTLILSRLESDDAIGQIFSHLEAYTSQAICVDDDGRYSLEPCISTRQREGKMPAWQIATITAASIVVLCGFGLWIWLIRRQRKKYDEEFNAEVGQFQRGRHSRAGRKRGRSMSHHDSHRRSHDGNDHKDKRRRSSHHRSEKKRHHSEKKHRRQRTHSSLDV